MAWVGWLATSMSNGKPWLCSHAFKISFLIIFFKHYITVGLGGIFHYSDIMLPYICSQEAQETNFEKNNGIFKQK